MSINYRQLTQRTKQRNASSKLCDISTYKHERKTTSINYSRGKVTFIILLIFVSLVKLGFIITYHVKHPVYSFNYKHWSIVVHHDFCHLYSKSHAWDTSAPPKKKRINNYHLSNTKSICGITVLLSYFHFTYTLHKIWNTWHDKLSFLTLQHFATKHCN